MAEKLDTKWFKLSNYEALKSMSTSGWANVIRTRCENYNFVYNPPTNGLHSKYLKGMIAHRFSSITTTLKKGVLIENNENDYNWLNYGVKALLNGDSFSTVSVNSMRPYDVARLMGGANFSQVLDACEYMIHDFPAEYEDDNSSIPDENLLELAYTPLDQTIRKQLNNSHPSAYVEINLSATDEQIEIDFRDWLTKYRYEIGFQVPINKAHKNLVSEKDFKKWIDFGVIPYLDLTIIPKIEGKEITQNTMAQLIFQDEFEVDTTDRLRQVTKKEAERLIKSKVHLALSAQAIYEKITEMKHTKNHPDT